MPVRSKRCSGPCGRFYLVAHFWADAGAPDGRMSRCPVCEKAAREERAQAKANGEAKGEPDRAGRLVYFSPEERRRRSELARRMHAEGRLGAAAIGAGGPAVKRHRITDAVLDYFRQDQDRQKLVLRAYESGLKSKDRALRLRAAEALARMEEKSEDRMRADRGGAVDPAGMTQEELQEFVQQGLEAMLERGELPLDVTLGEDAVQELA